MFPGHVDEAHTGPGPGPPSRLLPPRGCPSRRTLIPGKPSPRQGSARHMADFRGRVRLLRSSAARPEKEQTLPRAVRAPPALQQRHTAPTWQLAGEASKCSAVVACLRPYPD